MTWADAAAGRGVAGVVTAHHRRRLARLGWQGLLDASGEEWAPGQPPPRQDNALEILVDGAEVLSAMAREIRAARSYVYLAGWNFDPEFLFVRTPAPATVREVLAEVAQRVTVRVLAWGALDTRERPMHCHHEKTIVVDGRVAFVGGIDLTGLAGDRWDTTSHPPRASVGWHDAAALVRGPVVFDLDGHFRTRWREVTGEDLPAPPPPAAAGTTTVQMLRTVPEGMYRAVPAGDFRILRSYLAALRSATRLIYLENQFLWSPEVVAVLEEKLRGAPHDDFRLLVVLPVKPDSGNDDTRGGLGVLEEADSGRGRLLACGLRPHSGVRAGQQIYVHAKVGIVDDRWLTLGSANLNEHSLLNDTEVNLVTRDRAIARETREKLWAEHLEVPREAVVGDPAGIVDRLWRPIAEQQAALISGGRPPTHRLTALSGLSRRSGLLLGPLQGLFVDG
ncbi:MAG: phospholipase D-like domain-containing protein [Candidatus Dormibacterales bacterium]